MGAMTYIGNGPNFMVKAIAEKSGVKMPSFFGYMAYSCVLLLPILVLANWRYLSSDEIQTETNAQLAAPTTAVVTDAH